jgi:hypothetical protein
MSAQRSPSKGLKLLSSSTLKDSGIPVESWPSDCSVIGRDRRFQSRLRRPDRVADSLVVGIDYRREVHGRDGEVEIPMMRENIVWIRENLVWGTIIGGKSGSRW